MKLTDGKTFSLRNSCMIAQVHKNGGSHFRSQDSGTSCLVNDDDDVDIGGDSSMRVCMDELNVHFCVCIYTRL